MINQHKTSLALISLATVCFSFTGCGSEIKSDGKSTGEVGIPTESNDKIDLSDSSFSYERSEENRRQRMISLSVRRELGLQKIGKLYQLMLDYPAPEVTLEGLKNIREVAKYYPDLSEKQHQQIVDFANNFENRTYESGLEFTAVDAIRLSYLELADATVASEIIPHLDKMGQTEGSDGVDNDNDGATDLFDVRILGKDDSVPRAYLDEGMGVGDTSRNVYHSSDKRSKAFQLIESRMRDQPWAVKQRNHKYNKI